jgi:Domain of unknown function (DUF4279)
METRETETAARTHVSIRIFAPNLSPEDVTRNLELAPDYTHHQGDYPRNNPKYSPYKHGMWLLNSKIPEEQSLASHLDNLLSILEPKRAYIHSLAQEVTVDFYCVLYSQNGFQLSPEILKRVGDLGAIFGVILYSDDEAL